MKADADDLAYDLIRVAADCFAKVCVSEVYDNDEAMLEAFSTALSGRLDKIKKSHFPIAHAQMTHLQELIEVLRAVNAEAIPS